MIRALLSPLKGVRYGWALVTPSTLLALSLLTYAIAGRLLEPSEFGRFAVAMAVLATIIPLVSLGAPVILIRHLAGPADDRAAMFRAAVYLTVLLASAFAVVTAGLIELLPGHVLGRWLDVGLAPVVALGAAATAMVDLRVSEDQAAFRFGRQFAGLVSASVVRLAGILLAIGFAPFPDHRAAVAGYVAGSILIALVLARSEIVLALRQMREAWAFVRRDLIRLGLPITASSILGVLTVYVDTLLAAVLLLPDDLAQYAVANRLSLIHVTAIGGLTAIAQPLAASLARSESLHDYPKAVLRMGLPLGAGMVLLSIVLAPLAVHVLFGAPYGPSIMIFVVLSVGFLLNYAGNPLSQVLYMTHRAQIMVLVQLGQLITFIALAGLAASRWGMLGLATTRTAANLLAVGLVIVIASAIARRATVGSRIARE